MIEVNADPNSVILPINENNINKNIYIVSKVYNSITGTTGIIAFVVKRKNGWAWLYANSNHLGQFHPMRSASIHYLLSKEFRDYHSSGGQIKILETSQELQDYLRTYSIDKHFQQLLEVPWSYL